MAFKTKSTPAGYQVGDKYTWKVLINGQKVKTFEQGAAKTRLWRTNKLPVGELQKIVIKGNGEVRYTGEAQAQVAEICQAMFAGGQGGSSMDASVKMIDGTRSRLIRSEVSRVRTLGSYCSASHAPCGLAAWGFRWTRPAPDGAGRPLASRHRPSSPPSPGWGLRFPTDAGPLGAPGPERGQRRRACRTAIGTPGSIAAHARPQ